MRDAVYRHIEEGSTIHTDEAPVFDGLGGLFYQHQTINHGIRQYRHYDITTNGIESVFAVLKRGLIGVYHRVSFKHLGRYVNEFSFRLNEGNVKIHTLDRLDSFVDGMADKRLTYNALTH
jgi:hypothetical protein